MVAESRKGMQRSGVEESLESYIDTDGLEGKPLTSKKNTKKPEVSVKRKNK